MTRAVPGREIGSMSKTPLLCDFPYGHLAGEKVVTGVVEPDASGIVGRGTFPGTP